MCGRFALATDSIKLSKRFKNPQMSIEIAPHYNIPPGSFIPAVYKDPDSTVRLMKWGLVPHWSRESTSKFSTFNARAETLQTSAVFREPYKSKRCLIPTTGFFEWKKLDDGTKQPYYIHLTDTEIFSFAGLYDIWIDVEGHELYSCSIITTESNTLMAQIHTRMPVILKEKDEEQWLVNSDTSSYSKLLHPFAARLMELQSISTKINTFDDTASILM